MNQPGDNEEQFLDWVRNNREQLEDYIVGYVAVHPEDLPPDYEKGMKLWRLDDHNNELRDALETVVQKIAWAYEDSCYAAPEDRARHIRLWQVLQDAAGEAKKILQGPPEQSLADTEAIMHTDDELVQVAASALAKWDYEHLTTRSNPGVNVGDREAAKAILAAIAEAQTTPPSFEGEREEEIADLIFDSMGEERWSKCQEAAAAIVKKYGRAEREGATPDDAPRCTCGHNTEGGWHRHGCPLTQEGNEAFAESEASAQVEGGQPAVGNDEKAWVIVGGSPEHPSLIGADEARERGIVGVEGANDDESPGGKCRDCGGDAWLYCEDCESGNVVAGTAPSPVLYDELREAVGAMFVEGIERWNADPGSETAHEYLGLTWDQYRLLVEAPAVADLSAPKEES